MSAACVGFGIEHTARFEEFEKEDWGEEDEDASDTRQWEDNWEEDTGDSTFIAQLRSQLLTVESGK